MATNQQSDPPVGNSYPQYALSKEMNERVANAFIYHAPKEDQIPRYNELRGLGMQMAARIVSLTPPSREQSVALTKLEEAIMWANAAIARNE